MDIPLKITLRGTTLSPAIEDDIRKRAAKLERFRERITGCHVMIAGPHRHHRQGNLWSVRIDLEVPGRELVVSRDDGADHAHEDLHVAIHDAFDAVARRLEDHARVQRGQVKAREDAWRAGKVIELSPVDEYGLLETSEGESIYFHAHAVLHDGFPRLRVGTPLRFLLAEGEGEKGPQASSVRIAGRHRVAAA